ncbi:MAG: YidC/Oxa1 family membrane protein insertase, partial [Zetaproteobacteria bacterium]
MTSSLPSMRRLAPILLIVAVAFVVSACTPESLAPGDPGFVPQAPLAPAQLGADPVSLLAWLFTPIFQAFFLVLVLFDLLTGNIAISIILLTLVLRFALIPLYRKQLVSTRQMQLLAPELKELQRKFKGDRQKATVAQQEFYKQRGINPASGCLPILLQLVLIVPMYSVISQGLTNHDVNQMLNVFGYQITTLDCPTEPEYNNPEFPGQVTNPCLDPFAFGVNWGIPEPQTTGLIIAGFGISVLAILSSLFQLIQSRMMLPVADPKNGDDPQIRLQRQMAYFLPLISIVYGGILPAGLFLYWIGGTVFSIGQQYLILGWGGTFPLFGRTPGFARDHTPRFPVKVPEPRVLPASPTSANKPTSSRTLSSSTPEST